jgi:hypothetical protein
MAMNLRLRDDLNEALRREAEAEVRRTAVEQGMGRATADVAGRLGGLSEDRL